MYLGIDCSTQSMTGVVIDSVTKKVVASVSIQFGTALPNYNAPNGFVEANDGVVYSDPCMWLDALALMLKQLQGQTDLSQIKAVSGSGQQHGSVYLNDHFEKTIAQLDATQSLTSQIKPTLSRNEAPIWMDASTSNACKQLTDAIGSDEKMVALSGSVATQRFTGPQIKKFAATTPDGYHNTAIIHLVSSFICSVLAGKNAPIDLADGSGMNLMDITTGQWHTDLLAACSNNLRDKLPPLAKSNTSVGAIHPYFGEKFNFDTKCKVIAFSGDNPNCLVGTGGALAGTATVSLGTSDVYFVAMDNPNVGAASHGHVFANPVDGYMALICFTNGSLAREKVKDLLGIDWDQFSTMLASDAPFEWISPYFVAESVPPAVANEAALIAQLKAMAPATAVKSVVISQLLNMKKYSAWIKENIHTIHVTGGASQNSAICQRLADVFDVTVKQITMPDTAALGAALRAHQAITNTPWSQLFDDYCGTAKATSFTPDEATHKALQKIFETQI